MLRGILRCLLITIALFPVAYTALSAQLHMSCFPFEIPDIASHTRFVHHSTNAGFTGPKEDFCAYIFIWINTTSVYKVADIGSNSQQLLLGHVRSRSTPCESFQITPRIVFFFLNISNCNKKILI